MTAGANTDRKSTRLNSSHLGISYAVFRFKKEGSADLVARHRPPQEAIFSPLPAAAGCDDGHLRLARHVSLLRVLGDVAVAYFFFNDTATTEIYTLSLHDALPI